MCVEIIVCYISVVFSRHSVFTYRSSSVGLSFGNECVLWKNG